MKRTHILFLSIILSTTLCFGKNPKNVILIIGDGMGLSHVHASMVVNKKPLALEQFKTIGFSQTYSANNFVTDSGAGGTAIACGVKTNNGMIGILPDSTAVPSILKIAERNGLATGMVVTCDITHATPASFIAHQPSRKMTQEIALDFLSTDIDVFIGGGRDQFENRTDKRNLSDELRTNGYRVVYTLDEVKKTSSGKLAAMLNNGHIPAYPERGNMLPESVKAATAILDNNKKGFFLMIEGSQIDWAAHDNKPDRIIDEMLDFDRSIAVVLDYAKKHKNTLVIVTSDHETGGLTLLNGNIAKGEFKAAFSTTNHTGVLVPVFAYGPGAENFAGFMQNTDFKGKIEKLLGIK